MKTWMLKNRDGRWAINSYARRDYVSSLTLAALITRYPTRKAARWDKYPNERPVKVVIVAREGW